MSGSTLEVFEDYQKARVKFVQRVAELATRPQKIEELQSAGRGRDGRGVEWYVYVPNRCTFTLLRAGRTR